ncbi:NUDIX domain-containing protein [Candidatus Woesearchaeota archaeon]|nr:NUDIX domain-containing protein [Candidatus Woesearchaeota archaeon]
MSEELVVIVDDEDNVIGKAPRGKMRKKVLMHRGTAALTFNSKGEILIHKRTLTKDIFPGYLDMLNGGAVGYDESYDENIVRELEEEIGVKNAKPKPLFKHRYFRDDNKAFVMIYKQVYDGDISIQEEEVEWAKFVSLETLNKMLKTEKFCPDGIDIFNEYLKKYVSD